MANIDPGGVFAQIVGTKACVSASDWDLCVGVIVNKLRGDEKYFEPGPSMLKVIFVSIEKQCYFLHHVTCCFLILRIMQCCVKASNSYHLFMNVLKHFSGNGRETNFCCTLPLQP